MREDAVVVKGYEKIIKGVQSASTEHQIKKQLFCLQMRSLIFQLLFIKLVFFTIKAS